MVDKNDLKHGVKVEYYPVGGTKTIAKGVVKRVITEREHVGESKNEVHATPDDPRVVIENEHTNKESAYKLDHVVKIVESE